MRNIDQTQPFHTFCLAPLFVRASKLLSTHQSSNMLNRFYIWQINGELSLGIYESGRIGRNSPNLYLSEILRSIKPRHSTDDDEFRPLIKLGRLDLHTQRWTKISKLNLWQNEIKKLCHLLLLLMRMTLDLEYIYHGTDESDVVQIVHKIKQMPKI